MAHLVNLLSCQALKLKMIKNLLSTYLPPSSRPFRSFQHQLEFGVFLVHEQKSDCNCIVIMEQFCVGTRFNIWLGRINKPTSPKEEYTPIYQLHASRLWKFHHRPRACKPAFQGKPLIHF
jgi:hypothetical protein